jgi:hypothetical protein
VGLNEEEDRFHTFVGIHRRPDASKIVLSTLHDGLDRVGMQQSAYGWHEERCGDPGASITSGSRLYEI